MRTILLIPIFIIVFTISAFAQVNLDSLFNSAINNSHNNNYKKSIEEASQVLSYDNQRSDVLIFIARVYSWKGNYLNSLEYINKAYIINKTDPELYEVWLNVLLWSKQYKQLLEVVNTAKTNKYNDIYNITLKTMQAYKALGLYKQAIIVAQENNQMLDSLKIKSLYNELQMLNKDKSISLFYNIDLFDNSDLAPHHLAYIDYAFKIKNNTVLTRLNYANRFNKEDLQAEIDYYHILKNSQYIYSNYGFGVKNELFPRHRLGLEYYFPFSNSFEASLGGRFLSSKPNEVYILTGHIGKYINNLWFALRPFYVLSNNALTTVLNFRLFGKNSLNYWGLELAYGNSPDDRYIASQGTEILRLKAYKFKLEKNIYLNQSNELKLSGGYTNEEFIANEFRNRYLFELIYKYKF